MVLYFKDIQSPDDRCGIDLGKRMSHRLRQLDYEDSLDLLLRDSITLEPGMKLYPGDQILIRMWDDEPTASWYLLDIGVLK